MKPMKLSASLVCFAAVLSVFAAPVPDTHEPQMSAPPPLELVSTKELLAILEQRAADNELHASMASLPPPNGNPLEKFYYQGRADEARDAIRLIKALSGMPLPRPEQVSTPPPKGPVISRGR